MCLLLHNFFACCYFFSCQFLLYFYSVRFCLIYWTELIVSLVVVLLHFFCLCFLFFGRLESMHKIKVCRLIEKNENNDKETASTDNIKIDQRNQQNEFEFFLFFLEMCRNATWVFKMFIYPRIDSRWTLQVWEFFFFLAHNRVNDLLKGTRACQNDI